MSKEDLIPAKKGEIRNPKGKPKGTRSLKTILRKYLESKTTEGVPVIDEIVLKLIEKAKRGNDKSIQDILDRYYGKATEHIEQNVKGTMSIQIIRKKETDGD
jgi:hypothetical protein